jgi:hypothetical protein
MRRQNRRDQHSQHLSYCMDAIFSTNAVYQFYLQWPTVKMFLMLPECIVYFLCCYTNGLHFNVTEELQGKAKYRQSVTHIGYFL